MWWTIDVDDFNVSFKLRTPNERFGFKLDVYFELNWSKHLNIDGHVIERRLEIPTVEIPRFGLSFRIKDDSSPNGRLLSYYRSIFYLRANFAATGSFH